MAQNYVLLERIELNASAASVTFSNIPQTGYTDLKIVASARTTYASTVEGSTITFNGSNTYSDKYLQGDGSSAASGSQSILNAMLFTGANATASTFGNAEMYIPNYTGTNQKSVSGDGVTENNGTQAFAGMFAGLATLTSGITTITIAGNAGGSFVSGSTFSLYGIAAVGTTPAVAPKADGGNVIATDGTYWYHAFTSNGTFTPQVGLSADVLVVAAGGGGGSVGPGAGAGGHILTSSQTLSVSNYTCTIGAGGAGGPQVSSGSLGTAGYQGNSSNVTGTGLSLTAPTGGGYGGGTTVPGAGGNGGSGGGGFAGGAAGTGISGQGYAGGTDAYSYRSGAGGGGAGGVGGNTSNSGNTSGNGGVGTSVYSSWGSVTGTGQNVAGTYYYAGGGGGGGDTTTGSGGTGGYGGGGAGQIYNTPGNGTANTGGGGGGGTQDGGSGRGPGGTGGSGIIIIRYAV